MVDFREPLDHGMLQRVISVVDADQKRIEGKISVLNHEQRWTFTPDQPWPKGRFRLKINGDLEDRAGNSIARPFEVDMFKKIDKKTIAKYWFRDFQIGYKIDGPASERRNISGLR